MPTYLIQKRIHTLLEYGVYNEAGPLPFTHGNIKFFSWEPDYWTTRYWLAESTQEADNFSLAWKAFQEVLTKVISRMAFVGQAYHTDIAQPYLIKMADSDMAYFRHIKYSQPVPLHFSQEEADSLNILLTDVSIPPAFYLYWNDAINAVGYSAKLVLMFAALEILFGKASRSPAEYYAEIEKVFCADLKKELFGMPEDKGRSGLRQRLIHGDYMSEKDTKNYVEIIHKTIVRHFNHGMLASHPINEAIVNPQRHLFGNLEGWQGFIRAEGDAPLLLKPVLEAFIADDTNPTGYDIVAPKDRPQAY